MNEVLAAHLGSESHSTFSLDQPPFESSTAMAPGGCCLENAEAEADTLGVGTGASFTTPTGRALSSPLLPHATFQCISLDVKAIELSLRPTVVSNPIDKSVITIKP